MKIAYFIMLHHKYTQFCWLFDAIYTEEDVFLIHVDKKSSSDFYSQVRSYVGTRSNVSFLPRRTVTYCGWSSVDTDLQAMKVHLQSGTDWQYFVNLSGQDYPIKPIGLMKKRLEAEWPRNFVRAWSFAKVRELDGPGDPHLKRLFVLDAFGHLVRTRIRLPFPRSIDIKYKGSAWHIVTRDFCRWVLTDGMTKRIEELVKYTWNPDELFLSALIMNSPYRDLRTSHLQPDFGHEIIWPGPKTLRMEDYDRLAASNALFARKFDETVDRQVLVRLAGELGFPVHGR